VIPRHRLPGRLWLAGAALAAIALPDRATPAPPAEDRAPAAGATPAAGDTAARRALFHDYTFLLPGSGGWELVTRAPENEALTVRLTWRRGGESFTLGQMVFERLGLFDPGVPRQPRVAFDRLADLAVHEVRREIGARRDVVWAGSRRDSLVTDGRVLYRLQYGLRAGDTDGLVWVVYWFPSRFAADGFFVQATLQMWRRPDREDISVLDDFTETLASLVERPRERDKRIVPDGPDRMGRAGLALPLVYYDARQRVLHSPHDTTQAPCAVPVADTVAVRLQATQLPGTVFFSFHRRVPPPGDRAPGEQFGKAFDRDGDGRFDLAFFSQGWAKGLDSRDIRTFYVVADEDGDGRVDAMVFEDGNNDRDQLVDCGVLVQDRSGRGEPDRAWVFDQDIAHPVRPIPRQGAVFLHGLVSRPEEESLDLGREFRDWSRHLDWLNRAAARCRETGAGRP
jgi:hypothetical protein